jgi:Protein of unknown function (DUF2523)
MMFGIFLSALNSILGFVFRSIIVKFILYFGLYFVTTEFISVIDSLLPNASTLNGAFSSISSGVWYFLDLFAFSQGLPLVMSAVITRFMIRRLPIIG